MDYQSLKIANRALNNQESLGNATYIKSKPQFFWFDLCGPCNLECKHCGFQTLGRTSEEDVSEDVFQTVIAELMPAAYECNLGGTNWGETTLSKHFGPFLQECKKHAVKVNLTTNGTRMNDEWFDDLLDTLVVIGFSMEGMEEQFEMMRGFKWRFFLKHIEKVCRGRADKGKDFRIEWRFCAHADNIHQLPDMIRLAKSIGVDRIQVMNLVPFLPSQKYKMLSYNRKLANQFFQESRRLAEELAFDINIPPDFDTGTFQTDNLVQIGLPGKTPRIQTTLTEMVNCYYPWQTCSINELGNVKPCCVHWRSMGSLKTHSWDHVWNGRRYRRLRASVNTKSDPICRACRMPKFDSDQNQSANQLLPGLREVARNLLTIRREKVSFAGVLNEDFDPRSNNAPRCANGVCSPMK
jgi:MoaA/NifB/PqqE/SkfB family radical SAM enzyme